MPVKLFIPAILWFLATIVALCLPGSSFPAHSWFTVLHADKYVHVAMFSGLVFLFARPFQYSGWPDRKKHRLFGRILIAGIAYGILMEFVQKYWIPNRSFELADIIADSGGCLLGYVVSRRLFSAGSY